MLSITVSVSSFRININIEEIMLYSENLKTLE